MWPLVVVLCTLLTGVCALLGVFVARTRRRFERLPGRFRCRVRRVGRTAPKVDPGWRGGEGWAAWVHDVLLVRLGRWPATVRVLAVRFPDGSVAPVSPRDVKGLGADPVMLRMRLDDGDLVDLAAPAAARDLLVGPFLVACLADGSDRRPPAR